MREIEVFLILDNLDGKKSFGVDKLHPFLASFGAFQIFHPITYKINLSIKQTTFPDNLKIAKVENCIYHERISYFSSENIITPTQ